MSEIIKLPIGSNWADEISYQTKATMNEAGEIMGELFDKLEITMNKALRQEYQTILEINGNKMTIMLYFKRSSFV